MSPLHTRQNSFCSILCPMGTPTLLWTAEGEQFPGAPAVRSDDPATGTLVMACWRHNGPKHSFLRAEVKTPKVCPPRTFRLRNSYKDSASIMELLLNNNNNSKVFISKKVHQEGSLSVFACSLLTDLSPPITDFL